MVVHDANGCIGTGSGTIASSTPITVTYTATPSSCINPTGTATLNISGGLPPYNVTWYTYTAESGTVADSLPAGNYEFLVSDANGCVQTGVVHINPVSMFSGYITDNPATCTLSDGGMTIVPSGGISPFTYSWSTGATTATVTDLPHGTYYVTVTDDSGCHKFFSHVLPASSPLSVSISPTIASCIYASDGGATAVAAGGTLPYTYTWSAGAGSTASVSGLGYGNYSVTVVDAIGCIRSTAAFIGYDASSDDCYCTISGTVYTDANANCVQDPGENGISNISMHLAPFGWVLTDASGHYSFKAPGGSYTLTQVVRPLYPLSPCQANDLPVSVVAASGCTQIFDFADTLVPVHDMHISTIDVNTPQPGFPYYQKVVLTNDGTITESNIVAGYAADGQIFAPTFVPSLMFVGTGAYAYTMPAGSLSLTPGAWQDFYLSYDVPTDIPLGTNLVFKDTVAYMDPISNWLTDHTPWNNVNYFTDLTEGSYDPNSKEVKPAGIGPAGNISTTDSVLQYTIHFQNVGTLPAHNISVLDTLDADLDWNTLRLVYTSHPCQVSITESGIALFRFNNIFLPAQEDDDLNSNGQIIYTIKQKPSLADGTQIKNTASIYFDYNQPIITNTTLNTLGPLGVQHINYGPATFEFSLFPNPANNSFQVTMDNKQSGTALIEVANVAGTVLLQQSLALITGKQQASVNVSALAPGIYFVTIGNNSGRSTRKLVIVK